jgi:hypothetical protein
LLFFDADSPKKGIKRTAKGKEKVPGGPATAGQLTDSESEGDDDLLEETSTPVQNERDFDPNDPEGNNRPGPSTGRG